MSSSGTSSPTPTSTPGFRPVPPMPPMPPFRPRRSFAGPFVLIVLGVVCLLGTMRVVSLSRLAHLFANDWPALLIVWGVIKLIEHQRAQRDGTRAPGIDAGGVFRAIMIVVFVLMATRVDHVNCSGVRGE